MQSITRYWRISGKVQGVGFRYHTQIKANELKLVGWVRNTEDGAVEVAVCGPTMQVETFRAWCEQGPPSAAVSQVEEQPGPPISSPGSTFQIKR